MTKFRNALANVRKESCEKLMSEAAYQTKPGGVQGDADHVQHAFKY